MASAARTVAPATVPAPKRRTSREIIKKICILGDGRSQKTQLVKRYVYSMFDDKYITTIGTKVTKKSITFDELIGGAPWDVRLTLLNWDVLGQKQYSRLHPVYYQGAEGALVVCDASDADGAASLDDWAAGFNEVAGPVPMIFLLNRVVESAPCAVDLGAVEALCKARRASFMYVSAHTGENIDRAFSDLGRELVDRYLEKVGGALEEARPPRRRRGTPILSRLLLRARPGESPGEAEQIARGEIARIAAQMRA